MGGLLGEVPRTVRAGDWWFSKLTPLVGLAVLQIVRFDLDPSRAVELMIGVLVVTGAAVGAYGHVVNDACDVAADRRVGRENRMAGVSPAVRALIALALAATALLPALLLDYGPVATALLAVELLLPVAYSVPPVRLKERGLLGVAADAAAAHLVPSLIVLTAFAPPGSTVDPLLVVSVAVWAASLGMKNILRHQLLDRDEDRTAEVRTFAATRSPTSVRSILARVLYPAELVSFAAVALGVVGTVPLVAAGLVAYVVLDLVKLALGWRFVVDPGRPTLSWPHLPLISNTFYELWFPLAAATWLALLRPPFVLLVLLFVTVFRRNLVAEVADLASLAGELRRRAVTALARRRWGWRLELFGDAAARIVARPGADAGCRIEVVSPGELPWHVKLSRGPIAVERGSERRLRAEIRADIARRVTWCLVRGRPPWDALGLSEEVAVDAPWRSVVLPVRITDDDPEARLCLLLGGSAGAVELGGVSFGTVDGRPGGDPTS